MKKVILLFAACVVVLTSFAQQPADTVAPQQKYTFGDFFDQLTLPLEVGLAFPNGEEDMGIFFKTCIEWRHHITYGAYASLEYDTYDCEYADIDPSALNISGVNTTAGEERWNDILFGAGYRVPLVKDFAAYRLHPTYDNVVSFYCGLFPGVSIVNMRAAVPDEMGPDRYALLKMRSVVPTLKLNAGFEYHLNYTISIYAGVSYLQHFMRTPFEKSAMGVWAPSIGLTTFF